MIQPAELTAVVKDLMVHTGNRTPSGTPGTQREAKAGIAGLDLENSTLIDAAGSLVSPVSARFWRWPLPPIRRVMRDRANLGVRPAHENYRITALADVPRQPDV